MGVTYTDKHGRVHVGPTGSRGSQQEKKRMGAGDTRAPAPSAEQEAEGMFEVEQDVWVELAPGRHQKLHRAGTKIPDAEAVRLGLKKERAVEDKKAPRAENKTAPKRTTRAKQE